MDEKGFLLGVLQKMHRVYTKTEFNKGKLKGASQDGSREWLTLIGSSCADGTPLPPAIIYQAISGNVQDSWLEEWQPEEQEAYFISSASGWTNEEIGFSWLTTIFDRKTKRKARNSRDWRALFVDGHSSHLNMRFLDWCHHHRVLVVVYPPHSTHRLQPLDITCFRSLARHYANNLDLWMYKTQGLISMSKREFFGIFYPSFVGSFRTDVIKSGWEQAGIWPFNPEAVLHLVEAPDRPISSDSAQSNLSAQDWRKVQMIVKGAMGDVWRKESRQMINTIDHLATQVSLLRIENEGLKQAIHTEKRRRKRGKPLFEDLRSPDDGMALFISPKKYGEAMEIRRQHEEEQQQEEEQKAAEKLEKRLQKEEKARQVATRKAAAEATRKQKVREKAQKAVEREENKKAKAAQKQLQQEAKQSKKRPPRKKTQQIEVQEISEAPEAVQEVIPMNSPISRPRRNIKPPKHLDIYVIE